MASNSEYEQNKLWSDDHLNECAKRFIEDKLNVAKPLKSNTFILVMKSEYFTSDKAPFISEAMAKNSKSKPTLKNRL